MSVSYRAFFLRSTTPNPTFPTTQVGGKCRGRRAAVQHRPEVTGEDLGQRRANPDPAGRGRGRATGPLGHVCVEDGEGKGTVTFSRISATTVNSLLFFHSYRCLKKYLVESGQPETNWITSTEPTEKLPLETWSAWMQLYKYS